MTSQPAATVIPAAAIRHGTADGPRADAASGNLSRLVRLSAREWQLLRLRAEGTGSKEVAARLGISEQTEKNHMGSIYRKLGVDNLVGAFRVIGWLTIPGDRL
jgi:DNA-binding NarL/FixJ family response regulator